MKLNVRIYKKIVIIPKPIILSKERIIEKSTNYILCLDDGKIRAFGEAAPIIEGLEYKIAYGNPFYIVEQDLIYLCENFNFKSIDFNSIKDLHKNFSQLSSESLACLDAAIHDYISKKNSTPIWSLYTKNDIQSQLFLSTTKPLDSSLDFENLDNNDLCAVKLKITKINKDKVPWVMLVKKYKYIICDFNGLYEDVDNFVNDFREINYQYENIFFEEPFSLGIIEKNKISDRLVEYFLARKLPPIYMTGNLLLVAILKHHLVYLRVLTLVK